MTKLFTFEIKKITVVKYVLFQTENKFITSEIPH
ncbi:hypothetical protein SMM_0844 [Spiroplasma mirum ATCC 29335]|nr:hypothetical protein SMM_0844 [Spiroplasma mirum ATCC 29335]